MINKITRTNPSIVFLVIFSLVLGITSYTAQAAPEISGELASSLKLEPSDPYALSAEQDLQVVLEKYLGDSFVQIALRGAHRWPKHGADKQWVLELDETYVDYYGANYDLRVGKQRFNWGTAMQINPFSVLNPVNINNPLGDKLPVYALNLDYYLNDTFKLTGVYLPFFKPAVEEIKLPNQQIVPIPQPEASLKNSEFALKLSALGIGGADFSLGYFRGKEDLPTITMQPGVGPKPFYRDVQIFGADFVTTVGDVGIWAEGTYSVPKDGDSYVQAIIGGDYGFANGLIVLGQYLHRQDYKDPKATTNLLLLGANQTVGLYEWRLGTVYNLDVNSFMLNPEVNYSLADATTWTIGGRYFSNKNGPLGMLPQEQNEIYTGIKVSF